jgi:nitroreductase
MNETLKTIQSLRSIHGRFSEREVSAYDLRQILGAAVRAATASARQAYSIVVVEDRAQMKELLGYDASRALVFCVDFNRLADLAEHLGYDYLAGFPAMGLLHFVTGSTDAILAAQNAAVAARSLGIDSLFTNAVHRGDMSRTYRMLRLPEERCFPLVALLLGYPLDDPGPPRGRLDGPGVIHFGEYHRLSAAERDEAVRQYDDPERRLGLEVDWAAQGFSHYLEWLFGHWSGVPRKGKKAARRRPTNVDQMKSLLRRAGFLPK